MVKLVKDEHPIRLAFLGVVLALLYLAILLPSGFLEAARLRSYDTYCSWRNSLKAPPVQAEDLLLITIDEASQKRLGKKWPWDRSLFADFLNKLSQANPKLIVLDLVLSGESNPLSDQKLAKAIRAATPILLASYLDRHGNPILPLPAFTQAGGIPGLIDKPRDIDRTVRRLWAGIRMPMHRDPLYAIEIKAAALTQGLTFDQIEMGRELKIGSQVVPLEPPGAMNINYLVTPDQIESVSFWEIIQDKIPPERIQNKLVVIGTVMEITHDIYPTPLGLMPGVMIGTNGILTLLSGHFVRSLSFPLVLLAGFLFVTGILLSTYWFSIGRSTGTTLVLIALGVGVGFGAVFFLDIKAESLSVILLGGFAWLTGMLYKYLLLWNETVKLYTGVVTDPISGIFTARYFRLQLENVWARTQRIRKPLSLLAIRTGQLSDLVQKLSWDDARKQTEAVVEILRRLKPKNALLGRLGDDRVGVLLFNSPLHEARSWTLSVQQALPSTGGKFAYGLVCSAQMPLASGTDFIRSAEEALKRSQDKAEQSVETYDAKLDKLPTGSENQNLMQTNPLEYVASELDQRNKAVEKALTNLRQAHQEMQGHFLEVTKTLIMALETKDEYTSGHMERVSRYATRLAEILNLPKEEQEAIQEAALLHDIGKIGLPDEVLHKVGPLTKEEIDIIKQHLAIGAKILEPMKFFRPITNLIYHHHERYDGKGYPHGLTGEFIPGGAQVIAIADAFDAMTTNRGYNKPLNVQEALLELKKGAGTQFNPTYVEKFSNLIVREGPQLASHVAPEGPGPTPSGA